MSLKNNFKAVLPTAFALSVILFFCFYFQLFCAKMLFIGIDSEEKPTVMIAIGLAVAVGIFFSFNAAYGYGVLIKK